MKPRYVNPINGTWYWCPSKKMKSMGFELDSLGPASEIDFGKRPYNAATQAAFERAAFLNGLWDEAKEAHKQKEDIQPQRGDVRWLIARFEKDPTHYLSKSARTKEEMDFVFEIVADQFGDYPARLITPQQCRAWYNVLRVDRGWSVHKARKVFKWFNKLLRYAKNIGVRDDIPTADMEMEVAETTRTELWEGWELHEIATLAMEGGRADSGNEIPPRPSVAIATLIAYDTTLPQQDILNLRLKQWDGIGFTVKQIKKRGRRTIEKTIYTPVHPDTAEKIEEYLEGRDMLPEAHIVVNEMTGLPYPDKNVFGRAFRKAYKRAREANPDMQVGRTFQDIRKTALTEMGNSGATNPEIAGMSGHDVASPTLNIYVLPDKNAAISAAEKRWSKKASLKNV